ncbi:MAG TPA: tetratricopeptide repeat protein, partial [Allocoleopsis sp.]
RPTVADMEVFVDPFHRGEILFAEDCENRLNQIFGRPVELHPETMAAIRPHQFLVRMLSNLKAIYLSQAETLKALAAIERILLLLPDSIVDRRDRGLLYYKLGRWTEARQELEEYLVQVPTAQDASAIWELLRRMQNSAAE